MSVHFYFCLWVFLSWHATLVAIKRLCVYIQDIVCFQLVLSNVFLDELEEMAVPV